jgi:hypothetical protein
MRDTPEGPKYEYMPPKDVDYDVTSIVAKVRKHTPIVMPYLHELALQQRRLVEAFTGCASFFECSAILATHGSYNQGDNVTDKLLKRVYGCSVY